MSAGHTPGPWSVHRIGKGNIPIAIVKRTDAGQVSVLYPPQTPSEHTPDDMQLAAAAPELLDALQFAADVARAMPGFSPMALKQADTALAKARGDQS